MTAVVLTDVTAAVAAAPVPCPVKNLTCVQAGETGFDAESSTRSDGDDDSGNSSTDSPARPVQTLKIDEELVPTCYENTLAGNDALCSQAFTCPEDGDIRYWVFARTRDLTRPASEAPPFRQITEPPFRCVGAADDPAVDPRVVIAALIEREFQRVVVERGVAVVSPQPETLVNIPTRFETPTRERYDIPLTLAGQSVVITAQAERWTWQVGDGATPATTAKGTRGRVEHTYRRAAGFSPYVSIQWSGSYQINGEAPLPVPGRVTTDGETVELQVREARSELVAG